MLAKIEDADFAWRALRARGEDLDASESRES